MKKIIISILLAIFIQIVNCKLTVCDDSTVRRICINSPEQESFKLENELNYTLDELDLVLTDCTEVYFSSNILELNRSLYFKNLHNISFIGLHGTRLDCQGINGFQMENIVQFLAQDLELHNCSGDYSVEIEYKERKIYNFGSGLHITNSTDVNFVNVKIMNASGTGVSLFNTRGLETALLFVTEGQINIEEMES